MYLFIVKIIILIHVVFKVNKNGKMRRLTKFTITYSFEKNRANVAVWRHVHMCNGPLADRWEINNARTSGEVRCMLQVLNQRYYQYMQHISKWKIHLNFCTIKKRKRNNVIWLISLKYKISRLNVLNIIVNFNLSISTCWCHI